VVEEEDAPLVIPWLVVEIGSKDEDNIEFEEKEDVTLSIEEELRDTEDDIEEDEDDVKEEDTEDE
jgi:hypothetical protein